MKKILIALIMLASCTFMWGQNKKQTSTQKDQTPSATVRSDNGKHLERLQRRDARYAASVKFVDSLVLSRDFSFDPISFQREPAGSVMTIYNPIFKLGIYPDFTDIHLPYSKGITPPYYTAVFNYTISYVEGYTAIQDNDGWVISFSSTLFTANNYTFSLKIYSATREAVLSLSSDFYGTTTYNGTILAHY